MADYYSILGLTKNATDIEIKAAFRRLAKIYHPDKNPDPNARQLFERILKAYDTLINPHTRRRYDSLGATTAQPKQRQHHTNPKNRGQKEWSTDEEDLKRREYYKQHYHQAKYKAANVVEQKNTYSDYKYVLFATPIAVGLLMVIVSLFSSEPKASQLPEIKSASTAPVEQEISSLSNGDKPYNGFFGNIKTFDTQHTLQINNSSGYDAIIAVFDKKTNSYLQHAYLKNSYTAEFSKLPDTGVYWKCMLGKDWNKDKLLFNNKISGGFDSTIQYQNWKSTPTLFEDESAEEVTLLYVIDNKSKNKKYISSDIDFFEKQP
ncbi:MAG: DnaJ domain-containing protein [Bacteroidia bacterium]